LVVALVAGGGQGGAGHSVGHFPSYYPDEIRIDVMDPKAAGNGLADQTLHAYVGDTPDIARPVPAHVKSARSFGAFLVLSFDAASARFVSADNRCSAARSILALFRGEDADGFVFHPYPVTPYHADYLHHLDRIEAAKGAISKASAQAGSVKVGATGPLAQMFVKARVGAVADKPDAVLEVVPVDDLLATAGMQFNGWSGPPWVKEGWYHAHRLLAPSLDAADRGPVDEAYGRLIRGELRGGLAEYADTERQLVAALGRNCRRVVVGYTLREEYFNEAYPPGAENVAFDTITGFNSAIFPRTIKLKDYPWNGKLHLGVRAGPKAAWNPVAGFTDTMGRLMWAAVGDPAMIAFPFNASWMPNRIQAELTKVEGRSGGIKVPDDALRPVPGTGAMQRVGDWAFASAKVTYEVLASPFEDGSEQTVADLLYPLSFTYRWGTKAETGDRLHEPRLEALSAALQERLVGLKLVRVNETTHAIAEGINIVAKTPVLEVYLRDTPGDERQVAALAAPWSTVPWHLLALMEEAVTRGYAAFSAEEAARRGVPWLDLVRDRTLAAKLQELVAKFAAEGFRPEPLHDLVTADEARARWRLLKAFADKSGHFLVANGPYRLKAWTPDSVALEAVREMTYPLGFGTYDRFVNPPRAEIEEVTEEVGAITVRAAAEMVLKGGRGYRLTREPLLHTTARGVYPLLVVSRYLLLDPAGKVLKMDKMQWREDGRFVIDLPEELAPGEYTVLLAVFLDGNAVQPSAKMVRVRVGRRGSPG
jgi:hypothetical protein